MSKRGNARLNAQRDENEKDIVAALRQAGALVDLINGAGVPDLLVAFRGRLALLEVKNPAYRWRFTDAEKAWHEAHADCDAVHVVETMEDALAAIRAIDAPLRVLPRKRKHPGMRAELRAAHVRALAKGAADGLRGGLHDGRADRSRGRRGSGDADLSARRAAR